MISVLSNIQDDICNYADAISGITGTDVEIIDESLMRIAGTGKYRHMLNENVAKMATSIVMFYRYEKRYSSKIPANILCVSAVKNITIVPKCWI
jgi:hypothetical protein